MRFIHTSDWHLGRILHGMHLTEDQSIVLNSLKDMLEIENPDALIIAGDIYDRSIPPVDAVELFSNFTQSVLMDLNIPIIAMAGNHDGAERIEFGNQLLAQNNLHIIGTTEKGYKKIVLNDKYGQVDLYVIPYADPAYIRTIYNDDSIKNHNDSMRLIVEQINKEKTDNRTIAVAHGYVQGGNIFSESERPLSIGGTDIISWEHFKDFNYVALGHLHAPQRAGADYIRYSGSLMKYSASEATQKKSVYLVEMDKEGDIETKSITLTPPKDLRQIKGTLDEILQKGREDKNSNDYIMAIVEDEGALLDPMEKIKSVYPNAIGMQRTFLQNNNNRENTSNYKDYNKMSISNLFENFYTLVTDQDFTKEHREIFEDITQGIERE